MVNRHVRNVRKLCLENVASNISWANLCPALLREPEASLLPFDGVVISREGPTRTTRYKSVAGFVFDTKRQKRERESQALQVVVFLSPLSSPLCVLQSGVQNLRNAEKDLQRETHPSFPFPIEFLRCPL